MNLKGGQRVRHVHDDSHLDTIPTVENYLTRHVKNSRADLSSLWKPLRLIGAPEKLSDLLRSLLVDTSLLRQVASRSCQHANGFDKITLIEARKSGYQLRLHIWWRNRTPENLGDIHSHSWDFASKVVAGILHIQEFQLSDHGLYKYHYRCKVTPFDPVFEFVSKQRVSRVFECYLNGGSMYSQSHDVLHRASGIGKETTVTLVLQGPFIAQESNIYTSQPLPVNPSGELAMQWFTPNALRRNLLNLIEFLSRSQNES